MTIITSKNPRARLTKSEQTRVTDPEKLIWLYRQVPVLAVQDWFGLDLTWFQRATFNDMFFKNFVMLLYGRGIGKSWLDALFAVTYAMLYPKTKIGIIAPVFRQACYVFDYIEEFYDASPYFRAAIKKSGPRSKGLQRTYQNQLCKLYNGSFIEALPLGDGNKVRGRRYNVVIADEYAQIAEEIIQLVVRPMMNIRLKERANKLIVSSSAFYAWNHLYVQYLKYKVMEQRKPDLYAVHEYNYHDLMKLGSEAPYQIDEDSMNMQRADMTEEAFSMEHEAKFPIESKGFFPARLIESCSSYTDGAPEIEIEAARNKHGELAREQYVMGIDAARIAGGDNFAIQVIGIDGGLQRSLAYSKTMNGATFQQMRDMIRIVLSRFPVTRIMMDPAGGGTTFKDLLTEPWKHPITGDIASPIFDMDDKEVPDDAIGLRTLRMVNFTQANINHMYTSLKADMQHKRFVFPIDIKKHPDRELEKAGWDCIATKQELLLLETEPQGNFFKFVVPEGKKKDRATALALANMGVNELLIVPETEKKELPVGGWVRG
jgi:hypothetical protein